MFRPKLKPIALAITMVTSCALLAGIVHFVPHSIAQDAFTPNRGGKAILRPKVETTYREVTRDGITRQVPQTRTVFEEVTAPVYGPTNIKPLPHAERIGPLVQQLLGSETDADNAEIKAQLENMLGDQFDAMHAEQKDQIDQLSERLEKLQSQHQARAAARQEIIGRRINELLRQPDPLAWDPNASRRTDVRFPDDPAANFPTATLNPPSVSKPVPATIEPIRPNAPSFPSGDDTFDVPQPQRIWPSSSIQSSGTREPQYAKGQRSIESTPDFGSKDLIASATDSLYSAIGRYSVDKSEAATHQLRDAIENTQRMARTHTKKGTPFKDLAPLVKAIEAAAAQLGGAGYAGNDAETGVLEREPSNRDVEIQSIEAF